MTDQKFTRCPGCSTVFRVTAAQLALREGQVRCGHCRAVFDANDHFVSLDAGPAPDEFAAQDELMLGRPTVTLRSADALQPVAPRASARDERTADEVLAEIERAEQAADEATGTPSAPPTRVDEEAAALAATVEGAAVEGAAVEGAAGEGAAVEGAAVEAAAVEGAAAEGAADDPTAAGDSPTPPIVPELRGGAERFEWKKRRPHSPPGAAYTIAAVVLALGLVLQAVLEYRDTLAAHVPATRPLLAGTCRVLGCTVGPLRDAAALSIDASDLQADPARRGLLLLSATIRNRAGHAIAHPYLELTLTDSSDRIVARRAFAPADYAGAVADSRQGIPANGERIVRLFLDASATQQAGYQLYLFYP